MVGRKKASMKKEKVDEEETKLEAKNSAGDKKNDDTHDKSKTTSQNVSKNLNTSNIGKHDCSNIVVPFDLPIEIPPGLPVEYNVNSPEMCDDGQPRTMVHVQVNRSGEMIGDSRRYSGVDTWAVGYNDVSGVFDDVVNELKRHEVKSNQQFDNSQNDPCSDNDTSRRRACLREDLIREKEGAHKEVTKSPLKASPFSSNDSLVATSRHYASSTGFSDDISLCGLSWDHERVKNQSFTKNPIKSTIKDRNFMATSAEEQYDLENFVPDRLTQSRYKTPSYTPERALEVESTPPEGVKPPSVNTKETGEKKLDREKVIGYSFDLKKSKGFTLKYNEDEGASVCLDERPDRIELLEPNECGAIVIKINSGKPICLKVVKE